MITVEDLETKARNFIMLQPIELHKASFRIHKSVAGSSQMSSTYLEVVIKNPQYVDTVMLRDRTENFPRLDYPGAKRSILFDDKALDHLFVIESRNDQTTAHISSRDQIKLRGWKGFKYFLNFGYVGYIPAYEKCPDPTELDYFSHRLDHLYESVSS